jgi:hypothetical protein
MQVRIIAGLADAFWAAGVKRFHCRKVCWLAGFCRSSWRDWPIPDGFAA